MDQLGEALTRHHQRLNEILAVLGRYGFAAWADRAGSLPQMKVGQRFADPELTGLTQGERLRGALTELGTTFVKLGQTLSLRPDLVGPDTARELEKLQSSVAPDPPEVVEALVASELGRPTAEIFAEFEAHSLGSGSVAQVHRATLHDGTDVVVKVLHAGVEHRVREDLELMKAIAGYLERQDPEIAQYRPTVVVGEFEEMMRGAIDMGQELANLVRFGTNFEDEPDVVIPTPYPAYSSPRVLTMTRLDGQTLTEPGAIEASGWDVDALVRRATEIYIEMIFRDSLFHADPHPGNLVLLPDRRIGILDFGDVGYITGPRRQQLEALVIGVGTRDTEELTDTILEITNPPASVDVSELRADIDVWMQRYFLGNVSTLDVSAILTSWTQIARKHHLVLPGDLALLSRVLLLLQGLARGLGTEVRLTELLTPYVGQMMSHRFDPHRMVRHAQRTARAWEHLIDSLPEQILATLDRARTGELGVDFRVRDVDGAVDRLVDGILASAAILASAELVSRKAGPTIGGLSVAGMISAAGAALLGRRLAINRSDHKTLLQQARNLSNPPGR